MSEREPELGLGVVSSVDRSARRIGVEFPGSGSAIFQRTFSVALQVSGSAVSLVTPVPSGPRQPGQLAARAAVLRVKRRAAEMKRGDMRRRYAPSPVAQASGLPYRSASRLPLRSPGKRQ